MCERHGAAPAGGDRAAAVPGPSAVGRHREPDARVSCTTHCPLRLAASRRPARIAIIPAAPSAPGRVCKGRGAHARIPRARLVPAGQVCLARGWNRERRRLPPPGGGEMWAGEVGRPWPAARNAPSWPAPTLRPRRGSPRRQQFRHAAEACRAAARGIHWFRLGVAAFRPLPGAVRRPWHRASELRRRPLAGAAGRRGGGAFGPFDPKL